MIYLVAISIAVAIGLLVLVLAELVPARPRTVEQRLADIQSLGTDPHGLLFRRRRLQQRERVMEVIEQIGARLQPADATDSQRQLLHQAGYRSMQAATVLWGLRFVLAIGLFLLATVTFQVLLLPRLAVLVGGVYFGAMGWVAPVVLVRRKARLRQKEMQKALADALDLLVVCVEAGLGLNQALLRVAEEIRHISTALSVELSLVNAEIRAGAAREEALRNLAARTGLEDLRTLVTVLIQTDRFGTSLARPLRVHSETLRDKRRQRAEEAAAKTAIKLVFPLVMCIFPALFVVLIGPGLIMIFRALGGVF